MQFAMKIYDKSSAFFSRSLQIANDFSPSRAIPNRVNRQEWGKKASELFLFMPLTGSAVELLLFVLPKKQHPREIFRNFFFSFLLFIEVRTQKCVAAIRHV